MKIHPLDCGTMCPVGGQFTTGSQHLVCHCWLVESDHGLVLVDSGIGLTDVADPKHMSALFRSVVRPVLKEQQTARRQVEALSFKATDVQHIIVTHLDLDHAGGLRLFESSLAINNKLRRANAVKLSQLHAAHPEVNIVCAHDPGELGAWGTVSP